jgi:hypothetical protein
VLALGGGALLDPVAIAAPVAGGVGLVLLLGGVVGTLLERDKPAVGVP